VESCLAPQTPEACEQPGTRPRYILEVVVRLRALWLAPLLLLCVAAPAIQARPVETVPRDAIALVAGEPIPLRLFNQELHRVRRSYELKKRRFPSAGTPANRKIRARIVERFVSRTELRQKAKADLAVDITSAQVDFHIGQIRQQWGANEAEFRKILKRLGLTEELLRADIHAKLTYLAIADAFRARSTVSDGDIKAFYAANLAGYKVPATRDVRHILRRTRRSAVRIRLQITRGANFARLARKYSLDSVSRWQGGLVTVERGRGDPAFARVAFSLRRRSVSRPVRTRSGWDIIMPISRVRPPRTAPLAEVYGAIRQQLLNNDAAKLMSAWLHELELEYADKVIYQTGFGP
jgi:parvulin-like peptidyl-prolyl isomerase